MSDITLTRGDTAAFKFQRKDADGNVITTKAPKIFFTVKKDWKDSSHLLQKTIADMSFDSEKYYHFTITPEETDQLKFGRYVYDLEVIADEEGQVKTTVAKGAFTLLREATHAGNEGE